VHAQDAARNACLRRVSDDQARLGPGLAHSLNALDTSLLLTGLTRRIVIIARVHIAMQFRVLRDGIRRAVISHFVGRPHSVLHLGCEKSQRRQQMSVEAVWYSLTSPSQDRRMQRRLYLIEPNGW
jgi:hypothetical protein